MKRYFSYIPDMILLTGGTSYLLLFYKLSLNYLETISKIVPPQIFPNTSFIFIA